MKTGLAFVLVVLAFQSFCTAATYTVVNTNNTGPGSLRQAINDANSNGGTNTIAFGIPGSPPHVIPLAAQLPSISGTLQIDGTTQAGYSNAPVVWINGMQIPGLSGLWLQYATGCDVRAIGIRGCATGLFFWGGSGHRITACHSVSNSSSGISLFGASRCMIGGTNTTDRNVISGNGGPGLVMGFFDSNNDGSGNVVIGNFIGTDATGTNALLNAGNGIGVSSSSNRIGGTLTAERNIISGNYYGIGVSGGAASNNLIQGNYIGLDVRGERALSNLYAGILLSADIPGIQIGGSQAGAGNVISGNGTSSSDAGIMLYGVNVVIQGNRIGTDCTGRYAVPNTMGIIGTYTGNDLIGGPNPGEGNLISGNGYGIYLNGVQDFVCTNYVIAGNVIGLAADGTNPVPNAVGIQISGVSYVTIGGTQSGAGNVISTNTVNGLVIGGGCTNITVQGNLIGLDTSGMRNSGNCGNGITLTGGSDAIRIGGTAPGARNYICGNQGDGITISGQLTGLGVEGNYIGLAPNGAVPIGWREQRQGICIAVSGGYLIGGTNEGAGNTISGHWFNGMEIRSCSNSIVGNRFGTDPSGTTPVRNTFRDIWIKGLEGGPSADGNMIGGLTPAAANMIGASGGDGLWGIDVTNGINNSFLGNSIYGHTQLGIDLGHDDVTQNDATDADGGANNSQNYPILTNAFAGSTHVSGVFTSQVSRVYRLEFFASPIANALTNGEGQVFLGYTNVTTSASGRSSFAVLFNYSTPTGWVVAATATDPQGNTSEFSPSRAVTKAPDVDGNGIADFWETRYFGHTIGMAATNDPDGDGVSTLQEYWADTHPSNSVDRLCIDSVSYPSNKVIGFTTSAGRTYQMQAVGVLTGQWTEVGVETTGVGGYMTLSDTNMASPRFYRLKARLP